MNPIFYIDFYKVGHIVQYPKNVTQVWSNWTPRSSRVPDQDKVVHFGLSYFIQKYLIEEFNKNFFGVHWQIIEEEYREVIQKTLGVKNPKVDHLRALWLLGHLPITIYSLPEGTYVPLGVPALVITNTDPNFFWLPNYFETLLSNILWKPSTSATTASRYRKIFVDWATIAGETDFSFIDWQGHDFSMRGMAGIEDAILSGMGHLLSFSGTDTIPAILAANKYYGADLSVGGSVNATEHSVMSAGEKDSEFETFERLLTEVYPEGILSVVSDTWDLWRVLTEYVPKLKDKILQRNGKLVIRPDSGNPVKIIVGDEEQANLTPHNYNTPYHPSYYGTISLLAKSLGVTHREIGLPLINNGGAIYGDSITPERADAILSGIVLKHRLSPYNMVFGIGSYTYEYVTRDTYGFAMKATAVRKNGVIVPIFKSPVTDDGGKVSHKGIVSVYRNEAGELYTKQNSTEDYLENCEYEKPLENGLLRFIPKFSDIRTRVREGL